MLYRVITIVGLGWAMILPAQAQYTKLLDFETQIRVGAQYDLLAAHCFEGATGYFIVRGIESVITPEWESQIVKVTDIEGTPATTILVDNATWKAFTGGDEAATILPGNRMKIVGDYLQFLDNTTNAIYRVHKNTGALSLFVSAADVAALTGEEAADLLEETAFDADDTMAFFDQFSDDILLVDRDGNLSILITGQELETLYSRTVINTVSGGMTFDAQGRLYWTLDASSNTGSAGGSIYMRDCDGTLSRVLDEITILLGIPDYTYSAVQFNDIFAAPDGLVYFYDRAGAVDSIVTFDPADPENTITVFLSEADIQAGPAGPGEVNVSALNTYKGQLTWHHIDRWYDLYANPLAGTYVPKGDLDQDGSVDAADVTLLEACQTGPGIAYDPQNLATGCTVTPDCLGRISPDLDRDGDVDGADFGLLQAAYTIGLNP